MSFELKIGVFMQKNNLAVNVNKNHEVFLTMILCILILSLFILLMFFLKMEYYSTKSIPFLFISIILPLSIRKTHYPIIINNTTVKLFSDAFEIYLKEKKIEYTKKEFGQKHIKYYGTTEFIVDDILIQLKSANRHIGLKKGLNVGVKITPDSQKEEVFKWLQETEQVANELVENTDYSEDSKLIEMQNIKNYKLH